MYRASICTPTYQYSYLTITAVQKYQFYFFIEFKKPNYDDKRMGRASKKYLLELYNNVIMFYVYILLYIFRNGMTTN